MSRARLAGRLLAPRSLALVGASESSLWSQNLVANLEALGYSGDLHLVNPNRDRLFGRPVHPSLTGVPGEVDLAWIMTGTARAAEVLEDAGRKGVRSAVLLTAGFKEVGEAGAALEARLVARAGELGIGLLGPNCLGFVNYQLRLAAYGLLVAPPLLAGGVAFVSQSGAMLLHVHRMAQARAIGLARMVSIGNEGMLTAADFIEALAQDPDVSVIGCLLEGIRDGHAFRRAARAAADAGKPLCVLRVGRSPAAARSIAAHTGSLAGADAVLDAALAQEGAIRAGSLEELLETCGLLAAAGWPRGRRTAVITTSGGACGLVADLAHGSRIEIPDFAPATKDRLAALLPVFGTPQNPLDTTGVIVDQPELLAACLEAVAAEGNFDAYLVNTDPPREPGPDPDKVERRVAALAGALRDLPFAAVAATAALDLAPYTREVLLRHHVHFANGLTLGVRALDNAIRLGELRERRGRAPLDPPPAAGPGRALCGRLNEAEALGLLARAGIPAPAHRVAATAGAAARAAAELGYPVVLKVLARDIPHKSEVGGVRTGLRDATAVVGAFAAIQESVHRALPGAHVEGVLVARQVEPVAELLLGLHQDPLFGTVVVAGTGGIDAELLDDAALRLPPVSLDEARAMLLGLRGAPLLRGARGRPPGDLEAAAAAVVALARLGTLLGDRLAALDVNPLFVLPEGQGVLAGDALVELG